MKILLIHYRYLPSLAGVELIMGEHARLLTTAGHEVTILTAAGASQGHGEHVVCLPEFATPSPATDAPDFPDTVSRLMRILRPWCEKADRVVVHNLFTMPFHPATTEALRRLTGELPLGRFIHWLHDLLTPDQAGERVATVAVSHWRAEQFYEATGRTVQAVIPNGVDPLSLLPLTDRVRRLVEDHDLLHSGLLLFQPARLVPRKRVQTGLHLVATLRDQGGWEDAPVRLLVTAAPDEHRPEAALYYEQLRTLRRELGLEREVLFVHEHFAVAHADLLALYSLADVLWFPSQQEGFGLPVVEGALHRLPIFCANLPPMNHFDLPGAGFFDPAGSPKQIVGELKAFLEPYRDFLRTRKAAVRRFSWEKIAPRLLDAMALTFHPIDRT